MYICIEGCAHGDLDKIYSQIEAHEAHTQQKVDLLICCGDFQATRNLEDLACMAVPQKYLEMGSFYKYYTCQLEAPVLTIFIGGNHEASNHLQELSYGGWVAPNIYYLGYAGVITVNGVRIAGISGIYRNYNYFKGHFECPPYDQNTVRTVYSMRNLEVFRMMQLTPSKIDIMLSHDWPQGIWNHGDKTKKFGHVEGLLRLKPDFKADMDSGKLGNPPCYELLMTLKPRYWYSAHMHCRFDAKVDHDDERFTQFVALDKCLPTRNYFEFMTIGDEVERDEQDRAKFDLKYDAEWLAILVLTNKFLNCTDQDTRLPSESDPRWNFTPTEEEIQLVLKKFNNDLTIKHNFKQTVNGYDPEWDGLKFNKLKMPSASINIQTHEFCERLKIDDPLLATAQWRKIEVPIPNYSISDQEAFKDCNTIVSDQKEAAKTKSVLSLPKPKNMNDEEIDLDALEDDDDQDEGKLESSKTIKTDEKINVEKLEVQNEINLDVKKDEENEVQPAVKKFKRRNQEIYTATDE